MGFDPIEAFRLTTVEHPGMDVEDRARHLSQITTAWTEMIRAHRGAAPEAGEAQRRILERYGAAVYRYLLASLRDPDAAEELYQEFALRFVRGDFERATSGRGRFRDFLKVVLRNLVVDTHRRRVRGPLSLTGDPAESAVDDPVEEADRQFLETCRAELLARAWEGLAAREGSGGAPLHALLRYRADHPEATSARIAEVFSGQMGRPLSPEWARKWLARAREAFADELVGEVIRSSRIDSLEELEEELIELGLLEYCRPAIDRRTADLGPS